MRLREAIAEAEVITISAGANDVLAHVQVDTTTGEIAFNHEELTTAFHQVASNYKGILGRISEVNPKAEVYVMGYYNPYPHLPEAIQPQLEQLLQQLNHSIVVGIEGTSAVFVPTAEQISEDYLTYLPNPQNIHLSKAGYKVVANQFYQSLVENYDGTPEGPLVLTDITGNRFESYINQAVTSGLIKGYTDGTFKPNHQLTRAHAASLIVRALGLETDEHAPFKDIGHYKEGVQAEIAAAYHYGIIAGQDDENFNPSASITRAHLAVMIARTYEYVTGKAYTVSEPAPFYDYGTYGEEAIHAISMLYELDIATGSAGRFMPNQLATRGQAAKIFVNFMAVI